MLITLSLAVFAAYGFARYKFRANKYLYLYFLSGIIIPIKLGTANLFQIIKGLMLMDSLASVICINIAMCLPVSIFLLTAFIKQLPYSLEESAKIEGCRESTILVKIIIPLLKPALSTVTIMNLLPVWNDFYFPLLFLRKESLSTIPLGIVRFFGQYQTDWNLIFSGLTIASIPTILVFSVLSRQFIEGLTAGAVKN